MAEKRFTKRSGKWVGPEKFYEKTMEEKMQEMCALSFG